MAQLRTGGRYSWVRDSSPEYEVDVIPIETLKGVHADRLTLTVPGGCAIPRADLNQFGLFYVDSKGHALPVYQDDREYRSRLLKLGSSQVAPCDTSESQLAPHPCWKPRASRIECLTAVQDVAIYYRSSCAAGVREFRERLHSQILGHYDWQMPLIDYEAMQ